MSRLDVAGLCRGNREMCREGEEQNLENLDECG